MFKEGDSPVPSVLGWCKNWYWFYLVLFLGKYVASFGEILHCFKAVTVLLSQE